MIRKLKSGEYRLYSRKTDPKTGKRRNLGTFRTRAAARSMSARSSISSVPEADMVRKAEKRPRSRSGVPATGRPT
jgi:hypothetical protein